MRRQVCTVPYRYGRTAEKNSVSLVADGINCVPVLESSSFVVSKPNVEAHRHPGCVEIVYCRRGNPVFECGNRRHAMMPGQILVIQSDVEHHLITNRSGIKTYGLFFRFDLPHPLLRLPQRESDEIKARLLAVKPRPFAGGNSVAEDFRKLFDILDTQERGVYRTVALRSAVLHLVLQVIDLASRKALAVSKRARIEALVREVSENPERPYTLDELARRAGVSESLLTSLFRERTGLPPHSFLMQCRLAAALELIRNTDRPVAEIARRYAFTTPQHFANMFRRRYGITALAARNGAMPIA